MYQVTVKDWLIKDGEKQVYGKLYVPERAGKCPGVILSHGYNGSHAHFDAECRFFAARGYVAYAYDFCGGSVESRSSGRTTDMTLFTEREDLLAVLRHIRSLAEVDAQRVYLMGGSQGGMVTALAAAERPEEIRGVILYYPALNIPDDWRAKYPREEDVPEVTDFWGMQLGRAFFTSMRNLDAYQTAGAYKGDVLIITGDQDPIVKLGSARRTAAAYAHAELVVLKGEGHGFTPAGSQAAMERALELLEK